MLSRRLIVPVKEAEAEYGVKLIQPRFVQKIKLASIVKPPNSQAVNEPEYRQNMASADGESGAFKIKLTACDSGDSPNATESQLDDWQALRRIDSAATPTKQRQVTRMSHQTVTFKSYENESDNLLTSANTAAESNNLNTSCLKPDPDEAEEQLFIDDDSSSDDTPVGQREAMQVVEKPWRLAGSQSAKNLQPANLAGYRENAQILSLSTPQKRGSQLFKSVMPDSHSQESLPVCTSKRMLHVSPKPDGFLSKFSTPRAFNKTGLRLLMLKNVSSKQLNRLCETIRCAKPQF